MFNEMEDLFFGVKELIEDEWMPEEEYSNELDYRGDLYRFLKDNLKEGRRLNTENGRNNCDLEIEEKIGIEMKRNLKGKSQVDRLLGQLKRYSREYDYVLIVLCGDRHQESLDELRHEARDFLRESMIGNENFIKIIEMFEDDIEEESEEEYEDNPRPNDNILGVNPNDLKIDLDQTEMRYSY